MLNGRILAKLSSFQKPREEEDEEEDKEEEAKAFLVESGEAGGMGERGRRGVLEQEAGSSSGGRRK